MSLEVIINNDVTLEDLYNINKEKGVEFVIADGHITEVILQWHRKNCLKTK